MSDEAMRQQNRVAQIRRRPGSALEPIPLNDTMHDQPGILVFSS